MDVRPFPRLLLAGLRGGTGKTILSMGLLLLLRRLGADVRAFKKGPDYIDAAWLQWASGQTARNLDTYLMGVEGALDSFVQHGTYRGVNLIEGNRGLFDGFDAAGTHSSAVLARTLNAPVVLVVDATKMTRTAAALVLGCQRLDPSLAIRGVLLNNVNGTRHEHILRSAVEDACGVPVLGVLPRAATNPMPERHLGLVPPQEHAEIAGTEQRLMELVIGRLDLDAIIAVAQSAPALPLEKASRRSLPVGSGLRIGYIEDAAFNFYYAENLESLREAGIELAAISALDARRLPGNLHALYIGGGFPETHAAQLSANSSVLESLRLACKGGLPVYAECGGLMLLAQSVMWKGNRSSMAGVLPVDIEICEKPVGHGYAELRVDSANPFFALGTVLHGHEFHYSRIVGNSEIPTACAVQRGKGCWAGRDGLLAHNVLAGYTHLHAVGQPAWADGLIAAARRYKQARSRKYAPATVS